jgi:cell wall assembly regulator SMI1
MSLQSTLASVDRWLAQHAPETLHALPAPATDEQIAAVAGELDPDLHPDVWTLLRWHNGSRETFDLAPGFTFLNADEIISAAKSQEPSNDGVYRGWYRLWIPVASDGCGAHLVVDDADGPGRGRVLLADPEDGIAFRETWTSLAEVLGQTLEAMRDGTVFLYSRCAVEGGRLIWGEAH